MHIRKEPLNILVYAVDNPGLMFVILPVHVLFTDDRLLLH